MYSKFMLRLQLWPSVSDVSSFTQYK